MRWHLWGWCLQAGEHKGDICEGGAFKQKEMRVTYVKLIPTSRGTQNMIIKLVKRKHNMRRYKRRFRTKFLATTRRKNTRVIWKAFHFSMKLAREMCIIAKILLANNYCAYTSCADWSVIVSLVGNWIRLCIKWCHGRLRLGPKNFSFLMLRSLGTHLESGVNCDLLHVVTSQTSHH